MLYWVDFETKEERVDVAPDLEALSAFWAGSNDIIFSPVLGDSYGEARRGTCECKAYSYWPWEEFLLGIEDISLIKPLITTQIQSLVGQNHRAFLPTNFSVFLLREEVGVDCYSSFVMEGWGVVEFDASGESQVGADGAEEDYEQVLNLPVFSRIMDFMQFAEMYFQEEGMYVPVRKSEFLDLDIMTSFLLKERYYGECNLLCCRSTDWVKVEQFRELAINCFYSEGQFSFTEKDVFTDKIGKYQGALKIVYGSDKFNIYVILAKPFFNLEVELPNVQYNTSVELPENVEIDWDSHKLRLKIPRPEPQTVELKDVEGNMYYVRIIPMFAKNFLVIEG